MSQHYRTIKMICSARQVRLAVQKLCVRAATPFILILLISISHSTVGLADGTQRTRAQAIEIAKSRSGDGRVLSVKKKVNKNGESVFAVKIIVNGRVKVYAIPEFAN